MWIKDQKSRSKYYKVSGNRKPSPLLLRALKLGNFNTALDLGCGAGVDAKEMSRQGLSVTAIDYNPEVKKHFKDTKGIEIIISSFQNFNFQKYDFIFSKSALVFIPPGEFNIAIERVKESLNPNGIIALRLWGINDSAFKRPERKGKWTFVSKKQLKEKFKDFEIIELTEEEKDGKTALGQPKHWHFFNLIARKKS
jgi:trans-aconitate methyltransferase